VDARSRDKAAKPIHSEHPERKQNSLPEIRDPEDIADRFKQPHRCFNRVQPRPEWSCVRSCSTVPNSLPPRPEASGRSDQFRLAAGFLDFIRSRLRKHVRFDRYGPGQFARAQYLEAVTQLANHAELDEPVDRERIAL